MCRFICNSGRIRADQVCLEVEEIEGRLSANLQAPDCTPELVRFECVPLLTAVEMARLMADALRTDVVVVDRLGVWRDWLAARRICSKGLLLASIDRPLQPSTQLD